MTGVETTLQNTDNNPRDIAPVELLEPSASPLTRLMSAMGSKDAENPKIEWLENESLPKLTTLSATAASNATSYAVTDNIFRVGDVLRFTAAGFGFLVTVTAASAITGVKIGAATQATAASNAEVHIVGNANAEGATLREIRYPQLVTASNYCQIVRTPVGLTKTEAATTHYSGDERRRLQKEGGIEHAKALENMFFFGPRSITTTQRTCGGLYEFISTNVTNDSGGLTEAEWLTFLQAGFRYGSDTKVAFMSPKCRAALEGFVRTNGLRVNDDVASKYGVKMEQYVSGSGGTVNIVMKRDWRDSSVYGGFCFLVDLDEVKMRPLRPTRLIEDIAANDEDSFKDEYKTEVSLQVTHERKHSLLTGVT